MASREARRSKAKLDKKKQAEEGSTLKKLLPIPTLAIIALILFGLVFGLGGNRNASFNFSDLTFAEYDGRPITWEMGNFFAKKRGMLLDRAQGYTDEQAFRTILPYMIFHTAIMTNAEKDGIDVSDKEIKEAIKRSGMQKSYNSASVLERNKIYNYVKEELTEQVFISEVLNYDSTQNKQLVSFLKKMGSYERKFRYVQWEYSDFPRSQIVKYAEANKDKFIKIKLNSLSVKDQAKANEAYNKIRNGTSSFEEQKTELQPDLANSEAIWQQYSTLLDAISDKQSVDIIFSMNKGDVSEVIQVGTNWIIYKCEEPAVDPDLNDSAVIEEIKNYISQNETGTIQEYFETIASEFREKAEKQGFESAVREAGIKQYTTDFFPLNTNGLQFLKQIPEPVIDKNASLASAQYDTAFFTEIFTLKKEELASPFSLSGKTVVLQFIDDRHLQGDELDKIATDFKTYLEQRKNKLFQTLYGNPAMITQTDMYSLFVDTSKMPTPAEQEEQFQKAMEAFNSLFQQKK